jgi:3-oxoacyl-[acyl-carrier-protein] synthase-3
MVFEELKQLAVDPFQGGKERRAMAPGGLSTDMDTAAAREAIQRAGIDPKEIDLVMGYTLVPDFINVPSACVIHHNLGLSPRCISMNVDAVCNSFLMQVTMARELIASGRVRYALLVQSSAFTRLPSSGEPHDSWLGDGATAVVLGPVSEGAGVLSYTHFTDGSIHRSLVIGTPGKRWFDGPAITYSEDHAANYDMVTRIADRCKIVLDQALAEAGLHASQVDFFACHQAFLWLRRVCQDYCKLTNARSVDTFPWAGTVSAANLPLVMSTAERDGLLRKGDTIAMFQGGTGATFSGMILRWGT